MGFMVIFWHRFSGFQLIDDRRHRLGIPSINEPEFRNDALVGDVGVVEDGVRRYQFRSNTTKPMGKLGDLDF